jgi:hypothetical protein
LAGIWFESQLIYGNYRRVLDIFQTVGLECFPATQSGNAEDSLSLPPDNKLV